MFALEYGSQPPPNMPHLRPRTRSVGKVGQLRRDFQNEFPLALIVFAWDQSIWKWGDGLNERLNKRLHWLASTYLQWATSCHSGQNGPICLNYLKQSIWITIPDFPRRPYLGKWGGNMTGLGGLRSTRP